MKGKVHSIESEQQAAEVLKYFHDFHDGFIKRIELVSLYSFHQEGPEHPGHSHVCTGELILRTIITALAVILCTLQNKFTIPRPKFGTIEISDLNDL